MIENNPWKPENGPESQQNEENDREKNAKNRLFEGSLGLGRNDPMALKTSSESAYWVTGESQIQDIIESGYIRPPVGKLKGGHKGEVHWSRGGDKLFYRDKRPVLEIDRDKILNREIGAFRISDLKAIWVFDEEKGTYEDKLNEILAKSKKTDDLAD